MKQNDCDDLYRNNRQEHFVSSGKRRYTNAEYYFHYYYMYKQCIHLFKLEKRLYFYLPKLNSPPTSKVTSSSVVYAIISPSLFLLVLAKMLLLIFRLVVGVTLGSSPFSESAARRFRGFDEEEEEVGSSASFFSPISTVDETGNLSPHCNDLENMYNL